VHHPLSPAARQAPARVRRLVVLLLLAAATVVPGSPAAAQAPGAAVGGAATRGLPTVTSGHRPGPDALHLPPPRAPQLEQVGVWAADPILISGTQAYRDGEWLYQDFLFDDHGATGVIDRNEPYGTSTNLYSPRGGTFTYPLDERYRHNAADLVELRITALDDATALRVTLNTMVDPELVGVTIALGDAGTFDWPHGAGATSPAEVFLTAHGTTAELLDAATGEALDGATVAVDLERRQLDLRVPHGAWDPGRDVVPVTAGVGLWDVEGGGYLHAQPGFADADTPGGGTDGAVGSALVNVGPRLAEPTPLLAGVTMADTAAGARALAPWWRERQQSLQLTQGDLSPFSTDVDFGKLVDGVTDESTIPTSGPMDRIHASRYVVGQGVDPTKICFALTVTPTEPGTACQGRYVGQLQPYAVYVPEGEPPAEGWGLTLLMHSLSANHNQYLGTDNQVQLGERGQGHVVITPEARGPDGFYAGIPEAATFEVWADVARHHPIDPDVVAASGYSMGGFGTYRLIARYPDLFAGGFSVVAEPGSVDDQLRSMVNVPFLSWNAAGDELVNIQTSEAAHAALVEAEIAHEHDLFTTADHLTLAGNDEYTPGADFLGDRTVDRDPATVRYVLDPGEDSLDVVADHAYWLSGLALADPEAGIGGIEVHSAAFGVERPGPVTTTPGAGVLTGGQNQAMTYASRTVTRDEPAAAPAADRLEVTATNLAAVTVDVRRAGVTCDAEVVVDSDVPLDVTLTGCGGEVQRIAGPTRIETAVAASQAAFGDGGATAAVLARADEFVDALAGGPLAVAVDGPLLLAAAEAVPAATMAELDRVLPDGATVHVLGGLAALGPAVDEALTAAGYAVARHAGADRFETSALVAATVGAALGSAAELVLADGTSFADAIVAAPLAGSRGGALLLSDGERLPEAVRAAIERPADDGADGEGGSPAVVRLAAIGPAAATAVASVAASARPSSVEVFLGDVTGSVQGDVAELAFPAATRVGIARADVAADGLAGGALLGRSPAGPILLVDPDAVPADVAAFLRSAGGRIEDLLVLGGEAAVSATVAGELDALLAPPPPG
jgi:hypothetical protein